MSKHDKYTVEIRCPGGWAICCEGEPVRTVVDARYVGGVGGAVETYTSVFILHDPTIAEDFAFALNTAFQMRMTQEQVERAQDRTECQTCKYDDHQCIVCGDWEPGFGSDERHLP